MLFLEDLIHALPKIQEVPLLSSLGVNRDVYRDPIKPGIKGGAAFKAFDFTVRAKESLLGNLHGIIAIAQQTQNHHVDLLMVARDKFLESPQLPRLALLHQLPVA